MAPGSGPGRSGSCMAVAVALMSMTLRFLPEGCLASAAFACNDGAGTFRLDKGVGYPEHIC